MKSKGPKPGNYQPVIPSGFDVPVERIELLPDLEIFVSQIYKVADYYGKLRNLRTVLHEQVTLNPQGLSLRRQMLTLGLIALAQQLATAREATAKSYADPGSLLSSPLEIPDGLRQLVAS